MGNCIRVKKSIVSTLDGNTTKKYTPTKCDASTNTDFSNKKLIKLQETDGRNSSQISIFKQLNIGASADVEIEEPMLLKSLKQRHFEKTSNLSFVGRPQPRETTKVIVTKDETGNTIINEYILSKRLGRGTYGKVNLCIHKKTKELRVSFYLKFIFFRLLKL